MRIKPGIKHATVSDKEIPYRRLFFQNIFSFALIAPGTVPALTGVWNFYLTLDISRFGKRLLLLRFLRGFDILVFAHIHHSFPLPSFHNFKSIHASHWLEADSCDLGTYSKWFYRF